MGSTGRPARRILCGALVRLALRLAATEALHSPLLVVSEKGSRLAQTTADVGECSLTRDPLPSHGLHAFCVYVDGVVGDVRLGLASQGCDFTRPLGDARGWFVGKAEHGQCLAVDFSVRRAPSR